MCRFFERHYDKINSVWRGEILKGYLENGEYEDVLKSKPGVDIGFVDGNIEILYTK